MLGRMGVDIVDSILLIQYVKKTACSIQYNEVISVIFPAKNMQGQAWAGI